MAATGLANVKVGDPLILVTGNRFRGDEPVTVSRIGTRYLYVTLHGHERRERFDRKTGVEEGNRGIRARLMTQQQYDDMKQRAALFMELSAAGIDVKDEARPKVTTDQLRALLAVIKPTT
ncbi:hypothetical protein [Streptomyces rubradiris]|uniref:Uncharacterized protein n=1 Tax=Streptomyces rubradiris TaxID=285531 RepID=A0ABQ3R3J6_STRRR|nr:hypothetical protein [Streptomyces rubradiris]GHH30197.1 hypothetical protein GCM10018792_76370 [Streptomyces rubradiris]GHI50418.1 hypothetical protein Srubr_02640 [Streptomyces rubradiris]